MCQKLDAKMESYSLKGPKKKVKQQQNTRLLTGTAAAGAGAAKKYS